jgi:hypothetical protein
MEALIIVTVLLIFWTQQVLFPPSSAKEDKPDEAANLANALEKYLEAVFEAKNKA